MHFYACGRVNRAVSGTGVWGCHSCGDPAAVCLYVHTPQLPTPAAVSAHSLVSFTLDSSHVLPKPSRLVAGLALVINHNQAGHHPPHSDGIFMAEPSPCSQSYTFHINKTDLLRGGCVSLCPT